MDFVNQCLICMLASIPPAAILFAIIWDRRDQQDKEDDADWWKRGEDYYEDWW